MIARILTCRDRWPQLQATLSELGQSDWNASPIIHFDGDGAGTRMERINANWRSALTAVAQSDCASVILEDDVEINRNLRHNLCRWSRIHERFLFGSLYNGAGLIGEMIDPARMWGGQAIVLSPAMAAHILVHWGSEEGFADTRMPRIGGRRGPTYQHVPSLVQHVGAVSTWGGPFHRAADFDPDWRAP